MQTRKCFNENFKNRSTITTSSWIFIRAVTAIISMVTKKKLMGHALVVQINMKALVRLQILE